MLIRMKRQIVIFFSVLITLLTVHQVYNLFTRNPKNDYIDITYGDIGRLFGTKSRYPNRENLPLNFNTEPNKNFKLKQIQLLSRHGTRYPTGNSHFVDQIGNLTEFLYSNSQIFPEQFEFLNSFENPYDDDDYGLLVPQGVTDMQMLAKRAMKRYSSLMDNISNITSIEIHSTNVSRVIDSALAFLKTIQTKIEEDNKLRNSTNIGLEGEDNNELDEEEDEREKKINKLKEQISTVNVKKAKDPLLYKKKFINDQKLNFRFKKSIEKRKKASILDSENFDYLLDLIVDEYNNNNDYFRNEKLFDMIKIVGNREEDWVLCPHISCQLFDETLDSEDRKDIEDNISITADKYIKKVIEDLRERLKFNSDIPDIIGEAIMSMCIFEVALNNTRDQFCSLIKEDSFKYYNFFEDFRSYYIKGYGNPVNEWLATPLLQTIVKDFDSKRLIKENENEEQIEAKDIILRFAHAETIFPLATLLGLYKDDHHLKIDDGPSKNKYMFRTSNIAPFAANFWFELYECDTKNIINYEPDEEELNYVNNINTSLTKRKPYEKVLPESTYIIRILLNEHEVQIPNCKPIEIVDLETKEKTKYEYFCLLSDFKKIYKDKLNTPLDDYMKQCSSI